MESNSSRFKTITWRVMAPVLSIIAAICFWIVYSRNGKLITLVTAICFTLVAASNVSIFIIDRLKSQRGKQNETKPDEQSTDNR
jgi:membrane protein YdbS with pleckstrin-like domain